jgi:oligopeptide/dipeptide ABC transporter ATP-binding protein
MNAIEAMTDVKAPSRMDPSGTDSQAMLKVNDLRVTFSRAGAPPLHAVNGLSYEVRAGRTLAIIGESGSGKSVSVRSLMGLLPPSAYVSGSAKLSDMELIGMEEKAMRQIRGSHIAMVFQDPARSLNPTMRVGKQIGEAVRMHLDIGREAVAARAVELLKLVRLPAAEHRYHQYPHQLSGGMRQRVMIAIALAADPKVLIADEATTALDVTTQAQIMELLVDLQDRLGTAVVMISHDLALAANYADDVMVMYAGRVVEHAETKTLFRQVRHPYTRALLEAIPQLGVPSHTELKTIGGEPPDLSALPAGCPFRSRCPRAIELCATQDPPLEKHEPGHSYACWNPYPAASDKLVSIPIPVRKSDEEIS